MTQRTAHGVLRGHQALYCGLRCVSTSCTRRSGMVTLSQLAWSHDSPGVQAFAKSPFGAGVQVQLPPLVMWESRLTDMLSSVEAYLTILRDGPTGQAAGGAPSTPNTPGPLFVALRLWPDASLAQLENRPAPAAAADAADPLDSRHGPCPIQRVPLSAFLHSDQHVWGTSSDPERVFRRGLEGLALVTDRLACRVPVVLVVPTRLMVSQSFCERLFRAAAACGVSTVAIELPSTATLFEAETQAERDEHGQLGAVTRRWHRLSPLCAGWVDLLRLPAFRALRDLRRHQVVPLHVLIPWLHAHSILERCGLEVGLTVDTTPPRSRYARRRAELEGPDFLVDELSQNALAYPSSDTTAQLRRILPHGLPDETGTRHFAMSSPLDKARTQSWQSREVIDDVGDRKDSDRRSNGAAPSWSDTARVVEAALAKHKVQQQHQQQQPSGATRPPPVDASTVDALGGLSLGPPPDDVKALILRSLSTANGGGAVHDDVSEVAAEKPWYRGRFGVSETGDAAEQHKAASTALFAMLSRAASGADASMSSSSLEDELAFVQHRARVSAENPRGEVGASATRSAHMGMFGREEGRVPAETRGHDDHHKRFGPGYWRCVAQLSHHVLPHAAFYMTMPTLNAVQVTAWGRSAETVMSPSPTTPAITRRQIPLVPVLLPVLTAPALEAQRMLREGPRRGPRKRRREDVEAADAGMSVLGVVDAPLRDLLDALPDQQAQGVPACVRCALSLQRPRLADTDGEDDGAPHTAVRKAADGGEATDTTLVIRTRRRRHGTALRPLEYVPPSFAKPFMVHLTSGSTAGVSREKVQSLRQKERQFEEEVLLPSLRDAADQLHHRTPSESHVSATSLLTLNLPPPGVDTARLMSSWQALFR